MTVILLYVLFGRDYNLDTPYFNVIYYIINHGFKIKTHQKNGKQKTVQYAMLRLRNVINK